MVVGSRYVAGASTAGDWGLTRVLNSRLATLFAAPLVRCSDPMAGFFGVDRSPLPDLASLRPVGYKIGLELMVRGRLRVGEAGSGNMKRTPHHLARPSLSLGACLPRARSTAAVNPPPCPMRSEPEGRIDSNVR